MSGCAQVGLQALLQDGHGQTEGVSPTQGWGSPALSRSRLCNGSRSRNLTLRALSVLEARHPPRLLVAVRTSLCTETSAVLQET